MLNKYLDINPEVAEALANGYVDMLKTLHPTR